jgi:hypothetical protein
MTSPQRRLFSVQLFGPAVVEDYLDEIVADERSVEVFEHVGVDVSEGAARLVLVAIGEGLQDPPLEIGSRMCCREGLEHQFQLVCCVN